MIMIIKMIIMMIMIINESYCWLAVDDLENGQNNNKQRKRIKRTANEMIYAFDFFPLVDRCR